MVHGFRVGQRGAQRVKRNIWLTFHEFFMPPDHCTLQFICSSSPAGIGTFNKRNKGRYSNLLAEPMIWISRCGKGITMFCSSKAW